VTLLTDLDAFFQEHRRCGELDAEVERESDLDDLHVQRGSGACRGVRLDSCQPSSIEVLMRLVGLAVALALVETGNSTIYDLCNPTTG
jgi:hypothetical protein